MEVDIRLTKAIHYFVRGQIDCKESIELLEEIIDRLLFLDRIVTKEEYAIKKSIESGKNNLSNDIKINKKIFEGIINSLETDTTDLEKLTRFDLEQKVDELKKEFNPGD